MSQIYDCAVKEDQGKRDYQEDYSELVFPQNASANIVIVSDGMGGHAAGDVASQTAVNAFADEFRSGTENPVRTQLNRALRRANDALEFKLKESPECSGMGCTLIGVVFRPGNMRWVSVGDSIIYLYRGGKIARLNEDHSLAPQIDAQARNGEITAEQARNHPDRSALVSALMGGKISLIDLPEDTFALHPGDWVIIASDGLETLHPDEIAHIIGQHPNLNAAQMSSLLVHEALSRQTPDQDNITVASVYISKDGTPLSSNDSRPKTKPAIDAIKQDKLTPTGGPLERRNLKWLPVTILALLFAATLGALMGVLPEPIQSLFSKEDNPPVVKTPIVTPGDTGTISPPTPTRKPNNSPSETASASRLNVKILLEGEAPVAVANAQISIELSCQSEKSSNQTLKGSSQITEGFSLENVSYELAIPSGCKNGTRSLSGKITTASNPILYQGNTSLKGSAEMPSETTLTLVPVNQTGTVTLSYQLPEGLNVKENSAKFFAGIQCENSTHFDHGSAEYDAINSSYKIHNVPQACLNNSANVTAVLYRQSDRENKIKKGLACFSGEISVEEEFDVNLTFQPKRHFWIFKRKREFDIHECDDVMNLSNDKPSSP